MKKIIPQKNRGTVCLRVVVFLLCLFALGTGISLAAPAPNANSVLILGSTVKDAASSIEAVQAAAAGFTVVVASDADWSAMTTADFASYRAIVFGDGMCLGSSTLDAAIANRDVWGQVVTGNVIAIGAHPGTNELFKTAANDFVQGAIRFAGGAQNTGAYVTLGCYMSSKPTDVSVLEPFGQFSVVRQNGCSGNARVLATNPSVAGLSDTSVSGWKCTGTADFVVWPESFVPLVVAADIPGAYVDPSGTTASPYVMVRGTQATPGTTLNVVPQCSGTDPTVDVPFPMSGNHDFFNESIDLITGDGNWGIKGGTRAFLGWSPQAKVTLQYDSNLVRQGESPGMVDTLDPGHGKMCYGFEATLDLVLDGNDLHLGGVSESICGDCALGIDGSSYLCSLDEQYIELFCGGIALVDACIWLTVTPTTTITPEPFLTERTVYYAGTPGTGPDVLTFPPNPQNDPFKVSCVQPAGTDVVYELANPRMGSPIPMSPGIDLGVAGGFEECLPVVGCTKQIIIDEPHLFSIPIPVDFTLNLTGPTKQTDLGPVQKDITPPDLTLVKTLYSGNEGAPIEFTAAGAKDSCIDYASLVWGFSDHGIGYGKDIFHTFQDNGIFSGQLAVTDLAGNRATKALVISVANLPPVVQAGPDTTALWGVPVDFNGSATDPGAADQATLVYSWSFGDGTPSATGGPKVSHAYSTPGTYTATLTVTDKDGGSSSSTRKVMVNKRNVSLGYLGDQQGVYNTLTSLSGSLGDELGSVVPGRTIVFTIGSEAGGSAATNSAGIASTTHLLALKAGTYTASATFAGDPLYVAASPYNAAYKVYQKPTSLVYTGALSGGPNKTINLSAVLTDSQNKPLAGRTIAFQLGSQSASAVTGANGIATTTLKLNQKNANYSLTSTFTPAGADIDLYLGSVASVTFKLQTK